MGGHEGPLIGTIIKPSVGLRPQETADLVQSLATAGIDFIKDDELQANGPNCPLAERVALVMAALNRHAERTGKRVIYAFNISGEVDEMRQTCPRDGNFPQTVYHVTAMTACAGLIIGIRA
ncbi:ribulose-bisphosphate carboxylase large chain [Roseovarius azorensis]|uniref:Ribulose-bisphosphate carboxylase large chain n=1 Tax=Roseovarius azorensis TaxID=1287727 RepID=A0A1H7X5D9_9RHOB|nr:RuBisCO large subunit C-terminal-like domain-containing protein [Roseovarius azorensis]SEM28794.1 ribulose-bisphosphate carboxylase large chain [Roseovarius azorensis]